MNTADNKKLALLELLDVTDETERQEALDYMIDVKGNNIYTYERESYLILTEEEADKKVYEREESLLEESDWYRNIPESIRYNYFDDEQYIQDVVDEADYGQVLSSYDGCQHEVKIDDGWYYLYRQN